MQDWIRTARLTIGCLLIAIAVPVGCGARSELASPTLDDGGRVSDAAGPDHDAEAHPNECGASGYCTTTTMAFPATFGGLAQGDSICAAEYPGAHFYRKGCDEKRPFVPALAKWPGGYGEIGAGACWNCRDWTSPSGPYDPALAVPGCTPGYATVAALVPAPKTGPASWRICEAGDWPLACCLPQ